MKEFNTFEAFKVEFFANYWNMICWSSIMTFLYFIVGGLMLNYYSKIFSKENQAIYNLVGKAVLCFSISTNRKDNKHIFILIPS